MKYRYAVLLFLIAFLLQTVLAPQNSILGVSPDFILCLVIAMAFLYEGNSGVICGVLFGILTDLGFSPVIGPAALSYLVVGLFVAELRRFLYRDSLLNIIVATVSGTVLFYLLYWAILGVFGGAYHFVVMLRMIPLLLLFHTIANILFYFFIGKRSVRHPRDRHYKGNRLYFS